jgi:hypothetical protein
MERAPSRVKWKTTGQYSVVQVLGGAASGDLEIVTRSFSDAIPTLKAF